MYQFPFGFNLMKYYFNLIVFLEVKPCSRFNLNNLNINLRAEVLGNILFRMKLMTRQYGIQGTT
jgi:hypothetical protein